MEEISLNVIHIMTFSIFYIKQIQIQIFYNKNLTFYFTILFGHACSVFFIGANLFIHRAREMKITETSWIIQVAEF